MLRQPVAQHAGQRPAEHQLELVVGEPERLDGAAKTDVTDKDHPLIVELPPQNQA